LHWRPLGAFKLLLSLNVTVYIIGSGTALTNLNYDAMKNAPSTDNFNVPSTFISPLNIFGSTTLNYASTCRASLNVSEITILEKESWFWYDTNK
jgi:hypothetical protein